LDWFPRPLLLPWNPNQVHTLTHVVQALAHTFRAGQLTVSLPPSSYGRTWALLQRPPLLGLLPLPTLRRMLRTRSTPTARVLLSPTLQRTTSLPIRRSKRSLAPSTYRTIPPALRAPALPDSPLTTSVLYSDPKRVLPNPPNGPDAKRRLVQAQQPPSFTLKRGISSPPLANPPAKRTAQYSATTPAYPILPSPQSSGPLPALPPAQCTFCQARFLSSSDALGPHPRHSTQCPRRTHCVLPSHQSHRTQSPIFHCTFCAAPFASLPPALGPHPSHGPLCPRRWRTVLYPFAPPSLPGTPAPSPPLALPHTDPPD
jgi:hypothetical protein